MEKLIELSQVTAGYGNKVVLREVSLEVWSDDFLGIIGPNGGGKTTQVQLAAQWLRQKGYEVVTTREPGGTVLAEKVRELVLDPS